MEDDTDISVEVEAPQHGQRGGDSQGRLIVSDQRGYVGEAITFNGRDLPASEEFEIEWQSQQGSWGVLEANEVVGPKYRPRVDTILTVETDESGAFDEEWHVQQDYGGRHAIILKTPHGQTVDRAGFEITPWFDIDRTEAPLGESFSVTGYGIGPHDINSNYQIAWDNGFVGFMTGVLNRGTATAEIRAVGSPGTHVIDVWRNDRGVPYLQNNTQSPFGSVGGDRQSRWTVEVTEPETDPDPVWVDQLFEESPMSVHYPDIAAEGDEELVIEPSSGQPGTTAFITGRNFPATEEVDLIWYRHEGHRVEDIPITPEPHAEVLPSVTTDEDGTFQVEFEIPPEQGSTRPITAAVDGKEVAITGFMIQPDIHSFEPKRGPVGTSIEIDLTGIGWTTYENSLFFVYDNKPLGYICGTDADDEEGIAKAEIPATGEPGWHFIDIYPSLFEMEEESPEFDIRPHLSYRDNHPMRPLPALHLAFKITEE